MSDFRTTNIVFLKKEPSAGKETVVRKTNQLQVLNGNLVVSGTNKKPFQERVKIALNIKAKSAPKSKEEWESIVKRREPVNIAKARSFQIDQNYWFANGATWVIPTQLFESTGIKLNLQPSPLLSTGFTVEIFLRYTSVVKEFAPNPTLAQGGRISFNIDWAIYPDTNRATSQFNVSSWKPEERDSQQASGSRRRESTPPSCQSSISVWSQE